MTTAVIVSTVGVDTDTGTSRDDLVDLDVVVLDSDNIGTAYAWTMAYRPEGSLAAFSLGPTNKSPGQFTVDREGPYLIGLQYTTPAINVASYPIPAGTTLSITDGATTAILTGIAGTRTSGSNDFDVGVPATQIGLEIAEALNDGGNGFSAMLVAHGVAGSYQVMITPVVDGTVPVGTPSHASITWTAETTEQWVRLRALTTFGSLHLVAAGEQYGASNPPVPVDIDPVGWTDDQNRNLLTLLAGLSSVSASGNMVYVDPLYGDHRTIQGAIDHCVAQNPPPTNITPWTVLVRPGTYIEDLAFADHVHVVGWPGDQAVLGGDTVVRILSSLAASHTFAGGAGGRTALVNLTFHQPHSSIWPILDITSGGMGILRCAFNAQGSAVAQGEAIRTGGRVKVEDCSFIMNSGAGLNSALVSVTAGTLRAERCSVDGPSGFSTTAPGTGTIYLRDVDMMLSGDYGIRIETTGVVEAHYVTITGAAEAVRVNPTSTGGAADTLFSARWSRLIGPISFNTQNITGPTAFILGSTEHGAITFPWTTPTDVAVATPSDTLFYDNVLVAHAPALTAGNVQDALDQIYTYAQQVRTLDDAYDAGLGGGGTGRDIVADAGAVRILDGNPPGDPTPLNATDGNLQVVSRIESGGIGSPEIVLDPNPFGIGPEVTLGEEIWAGMSPYGSPAFIWGNSTGPATYHNYDLFLSTKPTDGGGQVGSVIVRGGLGLNSGDGHDPSAGDVYLLGGDALGLNAPPAGTPPDGGSVYIAPGNTLAGTGTAGSIFLGRTQDATQAKLTAPVAATSPLGVTGDATFGTDAGAFTVAFNTADVVGDVVNRFNATAMVTATADAFDVITLTSIGTGPIAQVFFVSADPNVNLALGNFAGALQINGEWPSQIEVLVSAANEISFGPLPGPTVGPMVYNADTGKLTVPGVIDPTGTIYTESTLANITAPANGWTGTNVGGLFVADGTAGLDDNHLYYVFEDGSALKLSGGGTGTVVGTPPTQVDHLVRWDNTTATLVKDSSGVLSDAGHLILWGTDAVLTVDGAGPTAPDGHAYVNLDRAIATSEARIRFMTAATTNFEAGLHDDPGHPGYVVTDGAGVVLTEISSAGELTINQIYTLPNVDGAAPGEVLTTDAAGVVSWAVAGGALPIPDDEGQILYATTSAAFVKATPMINLSGQIVMNADGHMVVV